MYSKHYKIPTICCCYVQNRLREKNIKLDFKGILILPLGKDYHTVIIKEIMIMTEDWSNKSI